MLGSKNTHRNRHQIATTPHGSMDRSNTMCELIIYACSVGPLADQLAIYFQRTKHEVGPNAAHGYMPHCTLTGFFHDEAASIPVYAQTLTEALRWKRNSTEPQAAIAIDEMILAPDFHYLKLSSPWLTLLVQHFAAHVQSPSRIDALRLKDWLHLSLAYQFPAEQHPTLMAIAKDIIDPLAPVAWHLCLYERLPNHSWQCHQQWAL